MSRELFLVAYDVRNSKRLRHVHNVLKDFACGGQKSAFECYLSCAERKELVERTQQVMDEEKDALLVIKLSEKNGVNTLGKAVQPMDELYTYLG